MIEQRRFRHRKNAQVSMRLTGFTFFASPPTEQAEAPVHQSALEGRAANCTIHYILINRTWGVGIN